MENQLVGLVTETFTFIFFECSNALEQTIHI